MYIEKYCMVVSSYIHFNKWKFGCSSYWLTGSGVHSLFEGQEWKEGHFSTCFGSQEGTLVCVLAPKRAVYHVLTSQGGSLVCFANQEGTLARVFGSQEGTLVHILDPRRAL